MTTETCWYCGDEIPKWGPYPSGVYADGTIAYHEQPPWLEKGFCSEECWIAIEESDDSFE